MNAITEYCCFEQMFTNGMRETNSSEVLLRDISQEAFKGMLDFMYSGELNLEVIMDSGALLLQLLLLADQFGVTLLHQECCKILLECLSEVAWQSLSYIYLLRLGRLYFAFIISTAFYCYHCI